MDVLLVAGKTKPADLEIFSSVLAEDQVGMKTAATYKQAIEDLARNRYAIVILYYLNGGDDLTTTETVRIMKEISPELLLITVAEELPLSVERQLREAGLYYHLTMPIARDELHEVLRGAIKKQHDRRGP